MLPVKKKLCLSVTESIIASLENRLYEGGAPSWDELQGLFYSEYQRRSKGVDAHLYKRDKAEFKEKLENFWNAALKKIERDILREY